MSKASEDDGIPVELFQILKDDVLKVLHSICQQIWKTQQWPQNWKRSVFISIPKERQCQRMLIRSDQSLSHVRLFATPWIVARQASLSITNSQTSSGSSAFSKSSLNIWNFMVHVLLKPLLENFEHYFANMWDEHNCVVVWTFFGIAFLWYGIGIDARSWNRVPSLHGK